MMSFKSFKQENHRFEDEIIDLQAKSNIAINNSNHFLFFYFNSEVCINEEASTDKNLFDTIYTFCGRDLGLIGSYGL